MRTRIIAFALGVVFIAACEDPSRPDLNNPSVSDYSNITSVSQVAALATGLLGYDRAANTSEILRAEIMGRDGYNLPVSEPRWVSDLLGPNIDPGGFNGTSNWPFQPIRQANIGIHGVEAADASVLTDEQKNATLGFIKTFKALEFMRAIETRDTAGVPINVDIEPTGPVAPLNCKPDVLKYIADLLDEANTNLQAGGAAFPFPLPAGFAGFDDPAGFAKFNRGLAAKAYVYLGFVDYAPPGGSAGGPINQDALSKASAALDASFLDAGASTIAALDAGPQHEYSTASGDATNALYGDPAATDFRANARVVSEADAGDDRLRKLTKTTELTLTGVGSDWAYNIYPTPTTPVRLLTNKELIALKAEVLWGQGDYPGALALANVLRTVDGGLSAASVSGADAVLNQILYEKRYSLLWESPSRWVDARMFGKLNGSNPPAGLGMEFENAPLWNIPLPQPEVDARGGDLSKECSAG
ncbi:MAG TPA: hypothetical protein VIR34_14820 [Gemmatimonadaceae bacterium]|jgi:hypothetical protein